MSEITITKEQLFDLECEVHSFLAETATQCWMEGSELDDDLALDIAESVVREFHPELTAEQVDAVAEKIIA